MPWLHPSGGLVYHLRAWRHGGILWRDFHGQVHDWLARWRPAAEHLVLVGPSGGYALEAAFLDRFARITVLEPDALARRILARRFPGRDFRFDNTVPLAHEDGFRRLAERYPDGACLFCNLLGQRLVGQPVGFRRQAWLSTMESALTGHGWASWHDLASTHRPPDRLDTLCMHGAQADGARHLDRVLGHFWRGGELSIHDHECAGLAPALPREYAVWPLRPGQYHLVEWLAAP